MPLATTTREGTSSSEISWLVNFFSEMVLDDLSENDANLIFYDSGCICHRRRCSSCKFLLVKSDNPPPLPFCNSEEHNNLFEMANQSGLARPTWFCFVVITLAVQYHCSLLSNDAVKAKLFACLNQRYAFLQAVETVVKNSSNFKSAVNQLCLKGHSNFTFIINCAFNCFAKNKLNLFIFAIFIFHSRESELYRYVLKGMSTFAWELPFLSCLGHLSST